MKIRLEWKPQDLWVGAFWKPGHLWVCLLPCLPVHVWRTDEERCVREALRMLRSGVDVERCPGGGGPYCPRCLLADAWTNVGDVTLVEAMVYPDYDGVLSPLVNRLPTHMLSPRWTREESEQALRGLL
jgi:hypothetical protein